MFKNKFKKAGVLTASVLLSITHISAAVENDSLLTGSAVRHDTSPPLRDMLVEAETNAANSIVPADLIIPNILNVPPSQAEQLFNNNLPKPRETNGTNGTTGSNGLPSPAVDISVDGFTAADNVTVLGGVPLPPDTNGDVGINYYIQYVNLGWKIMNKSDGSVFAGPFIGNNFWTGFGGNCETNNAGDPIVLYDKDADRWVFSQFTSSGNPDGRQCFAISTTNDPLGPYHRYEFVFPGEFNDYPHIGIWDDESGKRSGYYFVTHDFFDVGGPNQAFMQASYAVVERDQMLSGDPAQFVRFTDTTFLGASSFGAQPAHLESKQLAPAGMCNPFVLGRPDQQGYQVVDFCVNWNDVNSSTLSEPFIADAGESWSPGPGGVAQPGTAQTLDTLAGFGRIMYRSSFRAYPNSKGLKNTLVFSFPVIVNEGQAGVRWAQVNFPSIRNAEGVIFTNGFEEIITPDPVVVNQGEYAPDSTDRWMPGISIDQDGNIGVAYSAANSSQNVFPGVRFTTRKNADPSDTLRDEQICVDGGGSQTSTSGRWGDYSSLSVDPVDECTFWASVEYQLTTAERNWSNRVCSFKIDNCGEPFFTLDPAAVETIEFCSSTSDEANYNFGINAFNGFSETVDLTLSGEPAGSNVTFPDGASFDTFPATGTFQVNGLSGTASGEFDLSLLGTSLSNSDSLDYRLSISQSATTTPAVLSLPADEAVDVESFATFEWAAVTDALQYRLQVFTDDPFGQGSVIDVIVDGLTYTTDSPLDVNTNYIWRVTALNNCGEGVSSEVFTFTTGSFVSGTAAECTAGSTANVVFYDDLEGDLSGWSQPAGVGTNTWTPSIARAFSGTAWFGADVATPSDQYLVSPEITLPSIAESPISLSYWNFQELETDAGSGVSACWDAGLLEISNDGGNTFTQIGPNLLLGDQYNGQVTANPSSPISGLQAWCASSVVPAAGEQSDISVVDLDDFAGQTVQFRFRLGTDGAVSAEGWYLDNITVQSCQ